MTFAKWCLHLATGIADCGLVIILQNLNDHLSDPSAINAFNYATKFTCVVESCPEPLFMTLFPLVLMYPLAAALCCILFCTCTGVRFILAVLADAYVLLPLTPFVFCLQPLQLGGSQDVQGRELHLVWEELVSARHTVNW